MKILLIDDDEIVLGFLGACIEQEMPDAGFTEYRADLLGRPAPRIVPLPLGLVRLAAGLAERLLANPPITRSMLGVLDHDDRIDPEPARAALGIRLTPLDDTMRLYLGQARDVVCTRTIKDNVRHNVRGQLFDQEIWIKYEIENFKDRAVTLDIVEQLNQLAAQYGSRPPGESLPFAALPLDGTEERRPASPVVPVGSERSTGSSRSSA